jgi:hypothetical protein
MFLHVPLRYPTNTLAELIFYAYYYTQVSQYQDNGCDCLIVVNSSTS